MKGGREAPLSYFLHFGMNISILSKLILTTLVASVILSCKKDGEEPPPQSPPSSPVLVKLGLLPRKGVASFNFGSGHINDGTGRLASISRVRVLMTDFRLTDASGSAVRTFPGKVIHWDSNDPQGLTTLGTAEMTTFSGGAMTLGLDDASNALTPSDFANPPLSDQTLYAGLGQGFRFFSIEGRIDADNDGFISGSEPIYSYACITAAMRRSDQLFFNGQVAGNTSTVYLGFDVAGLLNGVNVMADLSETGSGPLNAQLMSNLQTAIEEP